MAFFAASFVFAASPGIATIYILNNSALFGKREGILSALGIVSGGMIYNIIAAVGLSSILYTFPVLFNGIKIAGALYLFYIGIIGLCTKKDMIEKEWKAKKNKSYLKGVITNLANPKVLLFFMTFIPQFVENNENFGKEIFLLGTLYLFIEFIWFISLAFFTSIFMAKFKDVFQKYMKYISAVVYLGMGGMLIFK